MGKDRALRVGKGDYMDKPRVIHSVTGTNAPDM